jgi:hypothetical protein
MPVKIPNEYEELIRDTFDRDLLLQSGHTCDISTLNQYQREASIALQKARNRALHADK